VSTILVVDDHAVNREFLCSLLVYKGHRVLEAKDALEALSLVRGQRPDLVICDVLMPTMDGYEFVRQLLADPAITGTPVIFHTAHYHEREAQNLARTAGVAHVLPKPCEPELVLRVVNEALGAQPQSSPPLEIEAFDSEHLRLVTGKLYGAMDDLRYANQRLTALIELNLQLASQRDPLRLLDEICRGTRELMGARYAVLGVKDKDNEQTVHFVTSGLGAESTAQFGLPVLDQGILGEVQAQRNARRLKNSELDPPAIGLPTGYPPVHSLLAAPICSLSFAYGWICLTDKLGAEEFAEEDEKLLTILAAQAGRIYENGSLYVRVHRHATALQQEIMDRKHIEEQVRETRNFLASIFDNIPNMISVKDARDLRFVRMNAAGEKLIGHSEKEMLGKSDHDFFPRDQADFFVARDRETLAGGGVLMITEETLTAKDGSTKVLQTKKLPILDKDGNPQYLLAISEDITERQRAVHELAAERTLLRTLVDAMPDAIYTKDTASRFTMSNRASYIHSGLATEAEMVGKSAFDFYPREIAEAYQADDVKVIAGDTVLNREEAGVNAHGVKNWFLTTKVPLRDHAGKVIGIVGISRDITKRKVAEQQLQDSENKYRQLIEQASDGIFVSDADGIFVMVNSRGCQLLGYVADELVGLNGKVTYLEEETAVHTQRMSAVAVGEDLRYERMVKRKDGSAFPAEISLKMLDDGMIQVIFHDITKRREHEKKIARLSRIQAVLSGINSAIVRIRDRQQLFDEACRIAVEHGRFSLCWISVLDRATGKLTAVAQSGLSTISQEDNGLINLPIGLAQAGIAQVALRDRCAAIDNAIEEAPGLMDADGQTDKLSLRMAAIALGAKSVIVLPLIVEKQAFGILTLYAAERDFFDDEELSLLNELAGDISFGLEFIAKEEKVDYLAYYDTLTGLPNRSLFFDRLTHQLGSAAREGKDVTLVLMDLDRFRLVNDTLGRNSGDTLLTHVAQRMRESFRDADNVARIGADTFAVAISGTWQAAEAVRVLESHNRQMFGRPVTLGKEELLVSATAGIAVFPSDGENVETLFANAEAALRKAKETNSRFLFYRPEMNATVADSLRMENRLRRAIENEELVLWYQPKIDAKTGRLTGLEALMRWQDPETGLVPPMKFIPLMEQTGLIVDAGNWALSRVAQDCVRWTLDGAKPPRIAVNVSSLQLRHKKFLAKVIAAADGAEKAGGTLDLEITESVIMENVDAIIPMLQTIRGLGVEIYIDDFGTGYSSLAYIARLPIHSLKIDRSFVVGMTNNQDSLAIVRSVISLAHALRLIVVAEGVETEEQAAQLRQLDCDQMQGYLFSKPLPPEQVAAFLKQWTRPPGSEPNSASLRSAA